MVLVVGATGRLGGNLVRMLRQARVDVRCLVRAGSEYFWLNDTGASYFFGDLRNPQSLRRALSGCEYVIHAANIRLESTDNHHGAAILEGGKALIDAAASAGVKRFMMASCAAVDRGQDVPFFKFLGEVEAHLKASGLSWSILRFNTFVEEFADVARKAKAGKDATIWSDGEASQNPIWCRDAAIYTLASIDHPKARDAVLEIGGPDTLTVREATEQACAAAEADPAAVRYLSGAGLKVASRGISLVAGRRWENYIGRQAALMGHDSVLDTAALSAAYNIPLTPFSDAVAAAVAEAHPSEDPTARDTRVVHRQFQATVYTPGEIDYDELPEGPLVFNVD